MIEGVRLEIEGKSTLCTIDFFSDQLKSIIRKNLTHICNGKQKSESLPTVYSYQKTLDDFFQRFSNKAYKTQIGMIGELLSHLLVIQLNNHLTSVNPYYNLEEKSIKKGFDLVLFDFENDYKMWITEVKSGELGKTSTSSVKNKKLLTIAKNDLNNRLNTRTDNIWHNAINGAYVALKENDMKNAVIKILSESLEESQSNEIKSKDRNVILTSVLFDSVTNPVDIKTLVDFCSSTEGEELFQDLMVVSIHKSTITRVIDFLESEVSK